ncbi:MAG: hypothetical protein HRF51_01110 [bacterium]|jgi:hypothetical protein
MQKIILQIFLVALIGVNALLIWQNWSLQKQLEITERSIREKDDSFLAEHEGMKVDLRGLYAMPGGGQFFVPLDNAGQPVRSPLTLTVFFSAKTECPMNLSELGLFKKLHPKLRERGQSMVAVSSTGDSASIKHLLDSAGLEIPLVTVDPADGLSLDQLGLSPLVMPFKVVYDSTYSAIYMRGANNQPRSQDDFEKAVMRLSEWVFAGTE